MEQEDFILSVQKIIRNELKRANLYAGQWHLGKVDSVIDTKHIKCFVDGNVVSETIGANPDITFATGQEIWVVFINGNPLDKFALCKRAV